VVPGVTFNFEFWERCRPRRSTYPACRAVIAAREQDRDYDVAMTRAIQCAYYEQARNPSDDETLIQLAEELGLDVDRFTARYRSLFAQQQLEKEIEFARTLGVSGFSSLALQSASASFLIPVNYGDAHPMSSALQSVVADWHG